jgi:hypothetical protein
MVKLYRHSSRLAVLSSRSDGSSGVTGQHRASGGAGGTNEPNWPELLVRNKPNSDRGHVRGKSCMGKTLWFIIHAQDLGKTTPIARSGAPRRCPILPGGTRPQRRGTAGKCAKQTQLQAASGTPPSPLGQRQLYKQSQFPAEQKEGQRLGGKGVMVNSTFDRPRQNKAKLGQDGTSGGTVLQGGQSCETKPIPDYARRDGAGGTWDESVVQTNPIPAIMPIRRSAFPGVSRAKQRQFRRSGRTAKYLVECAKQSQSSSRANARRDCGRNR